MSGREKQRELKESVGYRGSCKDQNRYGIYL
jgi:hypothetical protein